VSRSRTLENDPSASSASSSSGDGPAPGRAALPKTTDQLGARGAFQPDGLGDTGERGGSGDLLAGLSMLARQGMDALDFINADGPTRLDMFQAAPRAQRMMYLRARMDDDERMLLVDGLDGPSAFDTLLDWTRASGPAILHGWDPARIGRILFAVASPEPLYSEMTALQQIVAFKEAIDDRRRARLLEVVGISYAIPAMIAETPDGELDALCAALRPGRMFEIYNLSSEATRQRLERLVTSPAPAAEIRRHDEVYGTAPRKPDPEAELTETGSYQDAAAKLAPEAFVAASFDQRRRAFARAPIALKLEYLEQDGLSQPHRARLVETLAIADRAHFLAAAGHRRGLIAGLLEDLDDESLLAMIRHGRDRDVSDLVAGLSAQRFAVVRGLLEASQITQMLESQRHRVEAWRRVSDLPHGTLQAAVGALSPESLLALADDLRAGGDPAARARLQLIVRSREEIAARLSPEEPWNATI
jgi:hypothetical protein